MNNNNSYLNLSIVLFILVTSFFINNPSYGHDSEEHEGKRLQWTFEGVLGYYDRAAIQRGFQVYNEVCAACHSMNLMTYRKLQDVGFSEDEVKSIASTKTIHDGPNDDGDMFDRPGLPSDQFAKPFANKKAAMAANGGSYPADLSLIVKADAHSGGANYIYSLLTGYENPPENFEIPDGKYYNRYFNGHIIAMPPPLSADGLVTYADGTQGSIDQMARDISYFLQWASEPELEDRKRAGIVFLIFFSFLTIVLWLIKKRIWKNVK